MRAARVARPSPPPPRPPPLSRPSGAGAFAMRRLKEHLRQKLIESGWRDQLKEYTMSETAPRRIRPPRSHISFPRPLHERAGCDGPPHAAHFPGASCGLWQR